MKKKLIVASTLIITLYCCNNCTANLFANIPEYAKYIVSKIKSMFRRKHATKTTIKQNETVQKPTQNESRPQTNVSFMSTEEACNILGLPHGTTNKHAIWNAYKNKMLEHQNTALTMIPNLKGAAKISVQTEIERLTQKTTIAKNVSLTTNKTTYHQNNPANTQ